MDLSEKVFFYSADTTTATATAVAAAAAAAAAVAINVVAFFPPNLFDISGSISLFCWCC